VAECEPVCLEDGCGDDGCGGSCGGCDEAQVCNAGACVEPDACVPECAGKQCGEDGCGGVCGECSEALSCTIGSLCGGLCHACTGGAACAKLDFSDGNLASWTSAGATSLITQLQSALPVTGGHMLKLTTGAGSVDKTSSTATLQHCLAPGAWTATIGWKFYSAEFSGYCGSKYQDAVNISATAGDQEHALLSFAIKDLCQKDACNDCGSQAAPLQKGDLIDVDQPNKVYMTEWTETSTTFELTSEELTAPFTLQIHITDVGDQGHDSVILIDRISFAPAVATE